MFGFFKKNKKGAASKPPLLQDIEGEALTEGCKVMALRYELGLCTLTQTPNGWQYVPEAGGEPVSYARMVDAITQRQKVKLQEI